jgi:hypothetical protein
VLVEKKKKKIMPFLAREKWGVTGIGYLKDISAHVFLCCHVANNDYNALNFTFSHMCISHIFFTFKFQILTPHTL